MAVVVSKEIQATRHTLMPIKTIKLKKFRELCEADAGRSWLCFLFHFPWLEKKNKNKNLSEEKKDEEE